VAAQWSLESAWGTKVTGQNNFFGIKGQPGTVKETTEFIDGKEVVIKDTFLNFTTPRECVDWLVTRWYKDYTKGNVNYLGINRASTPEEAAELLEIEGYATDPNYSDKLIKIMRNNSVPTFDQQTMKNNSSISLIDAARWYSGQLHQNIAWTELEKTLTNEQLATFASNYRKSQAQKPETRPKFPLDVHYFYQRDSKTGHGERSCQSSAIAMVIEYINPNLIKNDDDYLNTVFRYGDTVSQTAHSKALSSLGLKYKFKTNGSEQDLKRILDKGYPVPIGIIHKGSVNNPTGGGHWITLIGYDDKFFYVHDPFGELDLVNGGYPKAGPNDGKGKLYSIKNLMKRWLIANQSDGWHWDLSENEKK
jgi:uncharacterized protein YvpB